MSSTLSELYASPNLRASVNEKTEVPTAGLFTSSSWRTTSFLRNILLPSSINITGLAMTTISNVNRIDNRPVIEATPGELWKREAQHLTSFFDGERSNFLAWHDIKSKGKQDLLLLKHASHTRRVLVHVAYCAASYMICGDPGDAPSQRCFTVAAGSDKWTSDYDVSVRGAAACHI